MGWHWEFCSFLPPEEHKKPWKQKVIPVSMQQPPKHGSGGCSYEVPSALHQGQGYSGSLITFLLLVFLGNSWQSFQAVHGAQPTWIWSLLMLAKICQCLIFSYGCYGSMHLLKTELETPLLWLSLFFSVNLISRRFHSYRFGIYQQVAVLFPSWCEVNLCSVEIKGRVEDQVNCQLHWDNLAN